MLLSGVNVKRMKEGYSKLRNRAIASVFAYVNIIEKWGSGIPRIMNEIREYGLQEPEFIIFENDKGDEIVLDVKEVEAQKEQLMQNYSISSDMSSDIQ